MTNSNNSSSQSLHEDTGQFLHEGTSLVQMTRNVMSICAKWNSRWHLLNWIASALALGLMLLLCLSRKLAPVVPSTCCLPPPSLGFSALVCLSHLAVNAYVKSRSMTPLSSSWQLLAGPFVWSGRHILNYLCLFFMCVRLCLSVIEYI